MENFVNITREDILSKRNKIYMELYLGEIIEKEKPNWNSNNLILAPVGSGKSTLIEKSLIGEATGKLIWLVSNSALKDHVAPNDNKERERRASIGKAKRMYTTQNEVKYGDGDYEIHVMTYAEFGKRIFLNNDFVKDVEKIFCDEIHSLPIYQSYQDSANLGAAMKYLFNKQENTQIFYFTATDESLINLEHKYPGVLKDITIYDYREHKDIKKYVTLSEYKINHLSQIRPHLRARKKSFTLRGMKGLAFSRLISSQEKIAEIAQDEGLTPLVLWSINNADKKMTEHQVKMRDIIIKTGLIPEPYNMLIINSSMQEGWDLDDEAVKLAIINTTNETEKIQALGRIRRDVDVLIYKTYDEVEFENIQVPEAFLNVALTPDDKNELCEALDLKDSKGRLAKWIAVQKILKEEGYEITNKQVREGEKRVRISIIQNPENDN